jgi:hypothetical protein
MRSTRDSKESERKASIFSSGEKFIWLHLNLGNRNNIKYRRLSGIEVLEARETRDERLGNIKSYVFTKKGGAIEFEFNVDRNSYAYPMLDTEHNRKFLSTHYHLKIWIIDDTVIDKEISKRSEEIKKAIILDDKFNKHDNDIEDKKPGRKKISPVKVESALSVQSGMVSVKQLE